MVSFEVGDKIRVVDEIGAYWVTAIGEDSVLARHLNPDFDSEIQLFKIDIELINRGEWN